MASAPDVLCSNPTEDDIVSVLGSVTDWYSVGLKLGIPTNELDDVRFSGRPTEQKRQLAQLWLKALEREGKTPTWEPLLTVLGKLNMVRAVDRINQLRSTSRETETVPQLPKLSSKPTMRQLQHIVGTNGQDYRIIQDCAGHWKKLTDLLFDNSSLSLTRAIEIDHRLPAPDDKSREVFDKWINGYPGFREPVTWKELLKVLEELEQGELAKDLRMYALKQE